MECGQDGIILCPDCSRRPAILSAEPVTRTLICKEGPLAYNATRGLVREEHRYASQRHDGIERRTLEAQALALECCLEAIRFRYRNGLTAVWRFESIYDDWLSRRAVALWKHTDAPVGRIGDGEMRAVVHLPTGGNIERLERGSGGCRRRWGQCNRRRRRCSGERRHRGRGQACGGGAGAAGKEQRTNEERRDGEGNAVWMRSNQHDNLRSRFDDKGQPLTPLSHRPLLYSEYRLMGVVLL